MSNPIRDQEERRLGGNAGSVTVIARDLEEKRRRPDATLSTPASRSRDPEEVRLSSGSK
jgi:hypothetical protein